MQFISYMTSYSQQPETLLQPERCIYEILAAIKEPACLVRVFNLK
jgi:hypothetical protein